MIRKETIFKVAVLGLALAVSGPSMTKALADETPAPVAASCGVPVCDVAKELDSMRGMRQNERYQLLLQLKKDYKDSTDQATLKNLAEFGKAVANLFREIKEEDWMIREAESLSATALISLAKYSEPNAELLAGYYNQLSGEQARYAILSFWRNKINEFEDKNSLLEMLHFFAAIEKISTASKDPEYLANDARAAQNTLTHRVLELYPFFEGVYDIAVSCSADAGVALPGFCTNNSMNRAVIMDTQGYDGLEMSLVNGDAGIVLYTFKNIVLSDGGSTYDGIGAPGGVMSQIHLHYDLDSRQLSGWVKTADDLVTVEINGKMVQTPASVFDFQYANANSAPVSKALLNRTYKGTINGIDAALTIRQLGDKLGASIAFPKQPGLRINFQTVTFYPKSGILVLVGTQPNGSRVKMALFFKTEEGKADPTITGMAFTTFNGGVLDVKF